MIQRLIWLALSAACALSAGSISTPGAGAVGTFGVPGYAFASNGQTFMTPSGTDTHLDDFTFYGTAWFGLDATVNFQAYLYAWDTGQSRPTGSALWTSPVQNYVTPTIGYSPIQFTPGVDLTAGVRYVLFLSTTGLQAGQPLQSYMGLGSALDDVYSGGTTVYQNSTNDPASWTASAWSDQGNDLRIDANFSAPDIAAPEPASYLLGLAGLAAFGLLKRRARPAGADSSRP